jgi:hypothetical protein
MEILHKTYLLHGDELSIDRDEGSRFREFCEGKTFVPDKTPVAVPMCEDEKSRPVMN